MKNGKGILYKDGWTYKGSFVKDKTQGRATIDIHQQKQIEGEFEEDGSGKGQATLMYSFSNEQTYPAVYEGNFSDYINLSGYGELTIKKLGFTYKGYFINNMINGQGELHFQNGTFLTGIFKGSVMLEGEGSVVNQISLKPVVGKFKAMYYLKLNDPIETHQ